MIKRVVSIKTAINNTANKMQVDIERLPHGHPVRVQLEANLSILEDSLEIGGDIAEMSLADAITAKKAIVNVYATNLINSRYTQGEKDSMNALGNRINRSKAQGTPKPNDDNKALQLAVHFEWIEDVVEQSNAINILVGGSATPQDAKDVPIDGFPPAP